MPVDVLRRKERKEFGRTFPWKLKSMGLLSSTLRFLVTRAWRSQVFCKMLENSRFVGRVVRDGFPEWQWGRRLSQVGKADRKTSTNALFCSKCLAGLENEGILLCIGCSTRLLSSGKPPNNHPGCQLWFLGYSCSYLLLPVLCSSSIYCRWGCNLPAAYAPYPRSSFGKTCPLSSEAGK